MAILQALFSFLTKSAGKILNAIFGWAVVALFGQTSPKEQTMLSGVVAAAAVWPLLILGIVVPKVTLFVVSFVPLSKSVPSVWIRIVWIVLALLVPIVVGSVIATRSPESSLPESKLKKLLRGFQVTFALSMAFLLMLVVAPALKIANAVKGRIDVRIPALVKKGVEQELMQALVAALAGAEIDVRPADPPWTMTAPAGVLRKLGGRAFASFVAERPLYYVGDELQVNLNPNELLVRGEPKATVRAQTLAQEVLAPRDALLAMNPKSRDLERQIKRVFAVLAEDPERRRGSEVLVRRVDEIAGEVGRSDLPFDEWQIVYRELLQLDRALRGNAPLLAKEVEMNRSGTEVSPGAMLPARTPPTELEAMSNKELLQQITENAVALAKKEIDLAKSELRADVKAEVAMAKGLGVAGLCAIWTVSMLLTGAAFALAAVMPDWLAALVIAAVVLLVGAIAGLIGWGKRVKDPLQTTRRTLKEDVRWAKERIA